MNIANMTWLLPLAALFLIALISALFTLWRDKRDLRLLGYQNLVWAPELTWGRRIMKGLFVIIGLGLALLGAARLQGKSVPEDLNVSGVDIMVVLDVSKSMMTQDIAPCRLDAAKKAVATWLEGRQGDRVGVVIFAGEALVQVPLTLDLEAVNMVLSKADVDSVDRGGTDIGEGIRTALDAFGKDDQSKRGKVILLLTDGEITEGSASLPEVLQRAKDMKIPIISVGMGTPQGRPIPDGVSFWGEANYKRDANGSVHVSHLDEKTLKSIADTTGGVYIPGDSYENLNSIGNRLEGLQKTQMKGQGAMKRQELSPALGALAAGAVFLSSIL